jgi:transposase
MARHYAPEFKQEAVALVAAGHAVKDVAIELGLPQHTLWGWVYAERDRAARAQAGSTGASLGEAAPVDPAAYQAALKRIAELERENEFLGKASAFFAKKVHP